MAAESIIEEITDNYRQQYELYERMAGLSRKELDYLKSESWDGETEQLNPLLKERLAVIQEVEELNQVNRGKQAEAIAALGLEEFSLSHLEKCLPQEQYNKLQEIIGLISRELSEINAMDLQSHDLIKQRLESRKKRKAADAGYVQNVYRQAMEQGKKQQ